MTLGLEAPFIVVRSENDSVTYICMCKRTGSVEQLDWAENPGFESQKYVDYGEYMVITMKVPRTSQYRPKCKSSSYFEVKFAQA